MYSPPSERYVHVTHNNVLKVSNIYFPSVYVSLFYDIIREFSHDSLMIYYVISEYL